MNRNSRCRLVNWAVQKLVDYNLHCLRFQKRPLFNSNNWCSLSQDSLVPKAKCFESLETDSNSFPLTLLYTYGSWKYIFCSMHGQPDVLRQQTHALPLNNTHILKIKLLFDRVKTCDSIQDRTLFQSDTWLKYFTGVVFCQHGSCRRITGPFWLQWQSWITGMTGPTRLALATCPSVWSDTSLTMSNGRPVRFMPRKCASHSIMTA